MNNRPTDVNQIKQIMKRLTELSDKEKDILDSALIAFFTLFNMDPAKYQFDFRFHRR